MKIVHLSDTHIHTLKFHDEQRKVFHNLYEQLRTLEFDAILHTGDVMHDQTRLSPESVELTVEFLQGLRQFGVPVYILLGNHDGISSNADRLDAISPIVTAISGSDGGPIAICDTWESSQMEVAPGIIFHAFSIYNPDERFDREIDSNVVNVALYHGKVGSSLLNGNILKGDGEILRNRGDFLSLDVFSNYDAGLFGDIHEYQALDPSSRFCYAGSLLQTRAGETPQKGFLLWEISAAEIRHERHLIDNPHPYVRFFFEEGLSLEDAHNRIANATDLTGARVRIVNKSGLINTPDLLQMVSDIQSRFTTLECVFKNDNDRTGGNVAATLHKKGFDLSALTSLPGQQQMIRQHLTSVLNVEDEELVEAVMALHKTSYETAEGVDVQQRPTGIFSLLDMEWSNLFKFGGEHSLRFEDYHGLTGILGPNEAGKSSVVDILTFALFERIPKDHGKKLSRVINLERDSGNVKVRLRLPNGDILQVDRFIKRGKEEASSSTLRLYRLDADGTVLENLTDGSKPNTEKKLRDMIGTYEDFLMASYATQFDFLKFIAEGATERLNTLKRICDINYFDNLIENAKAEHRFIKKSQDQTDYAAVIRDKETEIASAMVARQGVEERIQEKKQERKTLRDEITELQAQIRAYGIAGFEAPSRIREKITQVENNIRIYGVSIDKANKNITDLNKTLVTAKASVAGKDRAILTARVNKAEVAQGKLPAQRSKMDLLRREMEIGAQAIEGVEQAPCIQHEDFMLRCPYIQSALDEVEQYQQKVEELERLVQEYERLEQEAADKKDARALLDSYVAAVNDVTGIEKELRLLEREITTKQENIANFQQQLDELRQKLSVAEANVNQAAEVEQLQQQIKELERDISAIDGIIRTIENELRSVDGQISRCNYEISTAQDNIVKQAELQRNFLKYDFYLKCLDGKTGIPMQILAAILPALNSEIEEIIGSAMDCRVFFDVSANDAIEVYYQRGDSAPVTIGMASGMQKQLASVVIRLALFEVSQVIHADSIFLDEPATAMSAERQQHFTQILGVLKDRFSKVFIITHMDYLADVVDHVIGVSVDSSGDSFLKV
jgi:DNA repair exonuclease SbcCD nuclease subunit/ABC-type branched-subunit amino acid transport system ATPase component/peptidoglycan hydrolase CwlO-like protein